LDALAHISILNENTPAASSGNLRRRQISFIASIDNARGQHQNGLGKRIGADAISNHMDDRNISWLGTISEELANKGPVSFTLRSLQKQEHLFAHRCALFYTPTENIPIDYIGSGPLDITLPIASPDYTDFFEIPTYRSPRFWVDLLQRQTGKLRWKPMSPARVIFVRHDYFAIRSDHVVIGLKGLLDALKIRTSGRRDGIYLHYFGAIVDDAPAFADVSWEQELVGHPRDARVRVMVIPGVEEHTRR
jgi:hypothetical protein